MVSQNVNELLQRAKTLSLLEREEFIELLRADAAEEHRRSEGDELAARLAKKGVILTVPPKRTPEQIARFKAWRPIELPGGPLSDDIIRDRR